jgi:hypothetical protein
VREQHNKQNKEESIKMVLLAVVVALNMVYIDKENIGCYFEATQFNAIFLYCILLPEITLRLISMSFWRTDRFLEARKMIIKCYGPILYACWFLYTVAYYNDFTPNCYEPYPSFGLFIFCVIMVMILPSAFLVICITSFLVLFCPCITFTLAKAYSDQRERA